MNNRILQTGLYVLGLACFCFGYRPSFPFAPAAGESGTTAVHMSSSTMVAWADGYTNMQFGANVAEGWKTPNKALGHADGNSFDVVVLGRRGRITLTFAQGIADGTGFDFAVFENSVSDTFLELAWVEVSSDGIHFVRFPNYSYTGDPVPAFGAVDPTFIYGLAGKYRQGYGTPFDLAELQLVADAIQAGSHDFTAGYVSAFTNRFQYFDASSVHYVRIVDIAGDGLDLESEGYAIYDPYPTAITAGFDLDAVGVMNQPAPSGVVQMISFEPTPHQKRSFGSVELDAVSDSGLPVSFSIQSGPAGLAGNLLTFSGTGMVSVVASQPGDATYAAAAPVLRSFHVAEEIQHIFVEPVPNQIRNSGTVQVKAYASSGLPVKMEVSAGPASVAIGETTHRLDLSNEAGVVELRAFQIGNATYAPAEDVYVQFEIVESGASNAPLTWAQWAALHSIPADGWTDSDQDGAIDFQEFMMGGDPKAGTDAPRPVINGSVDAYGRPSITIEYEMDRRALGRSRWSRSPDLASWTNTVPEIVEIQTGPDAVHLKVQWPAAAPARFFRLKFEEQ